MQKIRKLQAVIFNDTEKLHFGPIPGTLDTKTSKKRFFPKKGCIRSI